MLKYIDVEVRISNKNISYYSSFFPSIKSGDSILVPIDILLPGSKVIIIGICDFCGTEREVPYKDYNKQTDFGSLKFTCSKKCSIIKSQETNLDKYGVKNTFQSKDFISKSKKTKFEKYKNQNYNNRDSSRKTCFERYGVDHVSKLDVIKSKVKQKNIENFGVEYPAKRPDILNKMKQTSIENWGVDNFSKTDIFKSILREKWHNKMFDKLSIYGLLKSSDNNRCILKCKDCGGDFEIHSSLRNKRINNGENICTKCNPKKQNTTQNEIYKFISENCNYEIILSDRNLLNNKEIDIFIPELKLGFEYNGLYWHSEIFKDRWYHKEKTEQCRKNQIELFHIWEDDWLNKKDIVKSIIMNKIGKTPIRIYARKCEIREVTDNRQVSEFLNSNHMQGFVGSKIKIGLFYEDELVSLMTFGNLRKPLGQKSEFGSYELLRFCNKLNINVVGGASRLLKYFLDNYNPVRIISYSDSSRSVGNLYKLLGFEFISESVPNYYWVVGMVRKNRFNFRKDRLVKDGYDINKTEIEIMHELGFYRIWDCGSKKWQIDLKKYSKEEVG